MPLGLPQWTEWAEVEDSPQERRSGEVDGRLSQACCLAVATCPATHMNSTQSTRPQDTLLLDVQGDVVASRHPGLLLRQPIAAANETYHLSQATPDLSTPQQHMNRAGYRIIQTHGAGECSSPWLGTIRPGLPLLGTPPQPVTSRTPQRSL